MTRTTTPGRRPAGAAHWVLLILLAAVVDLLVLGSRAGSCLDAAEGSGAASSCTSGPAIGLPGAWVVGVLSVLVAAYAVFRLVGALRGR